MLNNLKRKLIEKFPILHNVISSNWGIDPDRIKEENRPTHYVFGVSQELAGIKGILQEDGNWTDIAKQINPERQSGRNIESMNCTVFSALNCIEMIMLKKFNEVRNFSDRFIGIMSGTNRNGNSPTVVLDTIRKKGLLPETDLPNNTDTFNWSQYYSWQGGLGNKDQLISKAANFLLEYDIGYETVAPKLIAMREALKYSPLYVAGYAWNERGNIYFDLGTPNHAFVITNIEQAIAYKTAYDSYEPFIKRLDKTYTISWPKIILIGKRGQKFNIDKLQQLLNKGIKYLIRAQDGGKFYKVEQTELKYVPDIGVIADELASDLKLSPENVNEMLKFLTQEGKIMWSDERYFLDLQL